MQHFSANIIFQIPSDHILISKVEFDKLNQQELAGKYWGMVELEQRINRKHEWIKENILYPSKFRNILDVNCDGFVYYPKTKGEKWSFHALKMTDFLDTHFHEIFSEKKYLM